jgi:hypothetical protein
MVDLLADLFPYASQGDVAASRNQWSRAPFLNRKQARSEESGAPMPGRAAMAREDRGPEVVEEGDILNELSIELDAEHESLETADIFLKLHMRRSEHPIEPLVKGAWR